MAECHQHDRQHQNANLKPSEVQQSNTSLVPDPEPVIITEEPKSAQETESSQEHQEPRPKPEQPKSEPQKTPRDCTQSFWNYILGSMLFIK